MPTAVPNRSPAAPARIGQATTKLASDEERHVEERPERAEVVDEVARLVRARNVAGEGEGANDDEADRRVDGDASDGNSPRLHG